MYRIARLAAAVWALALVSGCAKLGTTPTQSPLAHARMSPDSVVLDIFYVSVPFADETANGALWEEVDEQQMPQELRRRLALNGFRAGVIACEIPQALTQLLEPAVNDESDLSSRIAQYTEEPKIRRRHQQLRAGLPSQLIVSETYPSFPALLATDGGGAGKSLAGKSYADAQGIFELTAQIDERGAAQIEIVPELHHGPHKPNILAADGMWRMESSRSKEIYDRLRISATLAPGEMLLVASRPEKRGSLGDRFLTRQSTSRGLEQRFVIIRLSQTQDGGSLADDDPFHGVAAFKIPDYSEPSVSPIAATGNIPDADELGLPDGGEVQGGP